ncbi:hypothetical protein Dimus_030951 [Dionaea muscipula]
MTVIHLKKKDVVKSSVKGIGIEFDHERLATILGVPQGIESVNISKRCGRSQRSGENRRRDDVDAPEVEEDEGNKDDFDWEAVIDEATVEGESGSGERFYDAEDETQGSPEVQEEIPKNCSTKLTQQKDRLLQSRPSRPTSADSRSRISKFRT